MTKTNDIDSYRKRTLGTTFRGDIRTIATLALFWKSKGEPLRSLNEVLRLTMEGMRELIVDKDPDLDIDNATLGMEILKDLGILSLKDKRINRVSLLKELSIDSLVSEGIDPAKILTKKVKSRKQDVELDMTPEEQKRLIEELEKQMETEVIMPDMEDLKRPPEGD